MHAFSHQFTIVRVNVWGESGKLVLIIFPSDFHPMVYFITWEMQGFLRQFSIAQENATKRIAWG